MASWTLWQPLVPRYQLTAKEITLEEMPPTRPKSSPASPRTRGSTLGQGAMNPRAKTPGASARVRKNRTYNNGSFIENDDALARGEEMIDPGRGKATMYFTMASPIHRGSKAHSIVIGPAFPRRRTPYIDNFKQQQRINSTKQNLEDPSTASPRHKTQHQQLQSPRQRTPRQVSQFPVTQMRTQEDITSHHNGNYSKTKDKPRARTAHPLSTPRSTTTVAPPPKRLSVKSAGPVRQEKQLSVNIIHPFDSPKPFLKNALYKDPSSPRRYAVRKLDDATMFLDDDKIIFIKRKTTKSDVISRQDVNNNDEEKNYIKHLRKLYLSEPKDLAKFMKAPVVKKADLTRERLEYELKTDHILNYYSRVDDKHDADRWALAMEESRKTKTPCTTPRSAGDARRTESGRRRPSYNSSPPRSARSREDKRPVSARSVNHSADGIHINHDSLSDWNVFLKFNTQSILHERQFYLQTPTMSMESVNGTPEIKEMPCDNHECRLCRLEEEMKQQQNGKPNKSMTNGDAVEKTQILEVGGENQKLAIKVEKIEEKCTNYDQTKMNENEDWSTIETEKGRKPEVRSVSTSTRRSIDVEGFEEDSAKKATEQLSSGPKIINVDLNLRLHSSSQDSINFEDKMPESTSQRGTSPLLPPTMELQTQSTSHGFAAKEDIRGGENGYEDGRGHL